MRKLASIQKILDIKPIKNADNLFLAQVLGWKVVIRKSDGFNIGDLVVFCEIDSVLPKKPEFEFLAKGKYRIKTVKLRGQVSQGIVFPLSILPSREEPYIEDEDVTEILGITKYDEEIKIQDGLKMSDFPFFIPKTDETRVQILEWILNKYKGQMFSVTEKLDGTSFTCYSHDGEFGICSRNNKMSLDDGGVYAKVAAKYDLLNKLKYNNDIAIQGEIIGPKIQGNKYELDDFLLKVFNVYDINNAKYLSVEDTEKTIQALELESVPKLDSIKLPDTVDELVELSKGYSVLNKKIKREGIVLRPIEYIEEYRSMSGNRLSFKVINPDFLLKY